MKYELRSCEVEDVDKIAEGLEVLARQYNCKILYWYIDKFRGNSQSGLVLVKHVIGPQLAIRKELKRDS